MGCKKKMTGYGTRPVRDMSPHRDMTAEPQYIRDDDCGATESIR
jgi:hypothetical protein